MISYYHLKIFLQEENKMYAYCHGSSEKSWLPSGFFRIEPDGHSLKVWTSPQSIKKVMVNNCYRSANNNNILRLNVTVNVNPSKYAQYNPIWEECELLLEFMEEEDKSKFIDWCWRSK